jgi:hypothetical protein
MKILLQLAGFLQLSILIASALVPRVLDWRRNLAGLNAFLRKLFWVYGIFIVLVIIGFFGRRGLSSKSQCSMRGHF